MKVEFELSVCWLDEVLAGKVVVGYEVDAFVVGANVLALAGLPGEADDVEVFV